MYCRKCGKEIANTAMFCKYCGTQVAKVPTVPPGEQVMTQDPALQQQQQPMGWPFGQPRQEQQPTGQPMQRQTGEQPDWLQQTGQPVQQGQQMAPSATQIPRQPIDQNAPEIYPWMQDEEIMRQQEMARQQAGGQVMQPGQSMGNPMQGQPLQPLQRREMTPTGKVKPRVAENARPIDFDPMDHPYLKGASRAEAGMGDASQASANQAPTIEIPVSTGDYHFSDDEGFQSSPTTAVPELKHAPAPEVEAAPVEETVLELKLEPTPEPETIEIPEAPKLEVTVEETPNPFKDMEETPTMPEPPKVD